MYNLFPPSENEWVEGLSKEDAFVSNVKVLALDNLYQRVVFGFLTEEIGAGEEPKILKIFQPVKRKVLSR